MTIGTQLTQTAGTAMNAGEYERLALSDGRHHWELNRGRLRQKPAMAWDHADVMFQLGVLLHQQISRNEYRIHLDNGRLRRATENSSVPDLIVIPRALSQHLRGRPDRLEVYPDPLPLVVEVWSPSTGAYDVAAKLPE